MGNVVLYSSTKIRNKQNRGSCWTFKIHINCNYREDGGMSGLNFQFSILFERGRGDKISTVVSDITDTKNEDVKVRS